MKTNKIRSSVNEIGKLLLLIPQIFIKECVSIFPVGFVSDSRRIYYAYSQKFPENGVVFTLFCQFCEYLGREVIESHHIEINSFRQCICLIETIKLRFQISYDS